MKTAWGCQECEFLGYRTQVQMTRARAMRVLTLCDCVTTLCQDCPGDRKSPYVYFDEESCSIQPCPCKTARDTFATVTELYAQSNIPPKYRYTRLREFNLTPAYPNPTQAAELETARRQATYALTAAFDRARLFIEAQKKLRSQPQQLAPADLKGLFFIGPPGTGKTLLATTILNELILTARIPCRYIKISRDFFQQLRATFSNESDLYGRTESVFNEIAQQEVLVIDDFGIQADSDWEQRTLYDLIDVRYENDLPTIFTSNIDLDAVKNLFKGRIYSRLVEMVHIVEFFQVRDYRQDILSNI
ncbi:MAG: ATP-binding protein [Turneriella sp.]|nr:ATP-binding protein [Turneriella sp.]